MVAARVSQPHPSAHRAMQPPTFSADKWPGSASASLHAHLLPKTRPHSSEWLSESRSFSHVLLLGWRCVSNDHVSRLLSLEAPLAVELPMPLKQALQNHLATAARPKTTKMRKVESDSASSPS